MIHQLSYPISPHPKTAMLLSANAYVIAYHFHILSSNPWAIYKSCNAADPAKRAMKKLAATGFQTPPKLNSDLVSRRSSEQCMESRVLAAGDVPATVEVVAKARLGL